MDEQTVHAAFQTAQGFHATLPGEGEWHLYGCIREFLQCQSRGGDIAFDGLLPALVNLLAHRQRGNFGRGWLFTGGQLDHG
jgi:hypothetical protein